MTHAHWRVSLCFLITAVNAEQRVSSSPLVQARQCLDQDGVLDLSDPASKADEGIPPCLIPGICPRGSVLDRQQCVSPQEQTDPLRVRDIFLTVHAACDASSARDRGLGIAGSLWLSYARLLGIPLHETVAGVLVLNPHLAHFCALQRFALLPTNASLLLEPTYSAANTGVMGTANTDVVQGKAFDVFVALRARTTRLSGASAIDIQTLLQGSATPLTRLFTSTSCSSFTIFEVAERVASDVAVQSLQRMEANYKFRHSGWNERPGGHCEVEASRGSAIWPPLRGSAWISALTDTYLTELHTINPFRHPLRFVASEPDVMAGTWYADEYEEPADENSILEQGAAIPMIILIVGIILGVCCLCLAMAKLGVFNRCVPPPTAKDVEKGDVNEHFCYGNPTRVHRDKEDMHSEPEQEPDEDSENGSASNGRYFGGWERRPQPEDSPPRKSPGNSAATDSPAGKRARRPQQQNDGSAHRSSTSTGRSSKVNQHEEAATTNDKLSPAAQELVSNMMQKLDAAWGSPLEERKRVFRELQRDLHPDKNMESEEEAEAAKVAFQKLMERRSGFLLDS